MDTATQVAIPEESSKGNATTAAISDTRNLTAGSVRMGKGKSETTEWYGDLPVTLCDMEGNTKGD
jgi:hypothetical protein